ncbi:MAG: SOS response-associated peptidase [Streptosporangiales bacterium]
MCGRYVSLTSTDDLVAYLDAQEVLGDDLLPSWNVAPTDPVRAVTMRPPHGDREKAPVRQLRTMRWGLVPSWSSDRKSAARMINARVETVTTKPAFRSAAVRRRCLLPALGYYEWCKEDGQAVPYFLHDLSNRPITFAGLYEVWRDPAAGEGDGGLLWTCTIITRAATDRIGHIHDRSPVVVPAGLQGDWLDCSSTGEDDVTHLLDAMPPADFDAYTVGAAVGSVRNNGPHLVEPAEPAASPRQEQLDLEL